MSLSDGNHDCKSKKFLAEQLTNIFHFAMCLLYCCIALLPLVYSSASACDSDNADRKRRSQKQNQCSASDSVDLIFTRSHHCTLLVMTPTTTPSLVKTREMAFSLLLLLFPVEYVDKTSLYPIFHPVAKKIVSAILKQRVNWASVL